MSIDNRYKWFAEVSQGTTYAYYILHTPTEEAEMINCLPLNNATVLRN
jgi:hypothetical protein